MKVSDKLLEALEKTYNEIPAKMFYDELIILISNDWQLYSENKLDKYCGIEVKEFNLTLDTQSIIVLKKKDFNMWLNLVMYSLKI